MPIHALAPNGAASRPRARGAESDTEPAAESAEAGWDDSPGDRAGGNGHVTRWPGSAPYEDDTPETLAHWVAAAKTSLDACLVVDAGGTVAGLSPTAAEMLGTDSSVVGRSLDDVLCLVDFTDMALEARGAARRIPPLIAVRENSLSRGVMRVRRPDGNRLMLDAVAAPIHDEERKPVGAVSFLASV